MAVSARYHSDCQHRRHLWLHLFPQTLVGSVLFHFFVGVRVERQRRKIDVRAMLGRRLNLLSFCGFWFGAIGLSLKGCFGTEMSRFWKKNFGMRMVVFMNFGVTKAVFINFCVKKVVFMNFDARMVSLSFTSYCVAKVFWFWKNFATKKE